MGSLPSSRTKTGRLGTYIEIRRERKEVISATMTSTRRTIIVNPIWEEGSSVLSPYVENPNLVYHGTGNKALNIVAGSFDNRA